VTPVAPEPVTAKRKNIGTGKITNGIWTRHHTITYSSCSNNAITSSSAMEGCLLPGVDISMTDRSRYW